jgi:hypothetical protein
MYTYTAQSRLRIEPPQAHLQAQLVIFKNLRVTSVKSLHLFTFPFYFPKLSCCFQSGEIYSSFGRENKL